MKLKPKRKLGTSEMLLVIGEELIQLGRDAEEKENYLRSVNTAWNIASLDSSHHEKCIFETVMEFKSINKSSDEDARIYEDNLRKLIKRKIMLFPKINIQILNSELTEVNDKIIIKTTTRKNC